MPLRLAQYDELSRLMARVGSLIDLHVARAPGFVDEVGRWLGDLEQALVQNRLPASGKVASQRGLLIAAERGEPVPGVDFGPRMSRRRASRAVALDTLKVCSDTVLAVIDERARQLEEAEKVAQQLVSIATLKGLVNGYLGRPRSRGDLVAMRDQLVADGDLVPYYAALTGLVTSEDALVLLDRAITLVES